MKITDAQFNIPSVLAIQLLDTSKSGANRPLFIRGIDMGTGAENDFVLKYRGAERMDERTSVRELVASLMAIELNMHTPKPVFIKVTENFLDNLSKHSDFLNIKKSVGINFGSYKIEPNNTMIIHQTLSLVQQQQALTVFIFDLCIQNGDRHVTKPNMFLHNDNIYTIDHEIAFGFMDMLPSLKNTKPFILNDIDVNSGKNHFFYRTLHKNRHIDLDAAFQPFLALNTSFWQHIQTFIPSEWQYASELAAIEAHCNIIIDNLDTFKNEIWTKLLT